MTEPIHDKDGKLTPDAKSRLNTFVKSRGVQNIVCCHNPSLTSFNMFGLSTLTIDPKGGSVVGNNQGGVPMVTIACMSCGEVRIFLAAKVFPEWFEENKRRDE